MRTSSRRDLPHPGVLSRGNHIFLERSTCFYRKGAPIGRPTTPAEIPLASSSLLESHPLVEPGLEGSSPQTPGTPSARHRDCLGGGHLPGWGARHRQHGPSCKAPGQGAASCWQERQGGELCKADPGRGDTDTAAGESPSHLRGSLGRQSRFLSLPPSGWVSCNEKSPAYVRISEPHHTGRQGRPSPGLGLAPWAPAPALRGQGAMPLRSVASCRL